MNQGFVTKTVNIKGRDVLGVEIKFPKANLVVLSAEKGYIMCGYLNIEASEKFNEAACVVTGVKTIEELLEGKIVKLTSLAKKFGIKEMMTAKEALEFLV